MKNQRFLFYHLYYMNFLQKYIKYKNKYIQLKNQIGSGNNTLPGSLFQLMNLFVKNLPFEVSIEINKDIDGTINLFLTKGFMHETDYLHESHTLCGIHIHTHPLSLSQRQNNVYWAPSGRDIVHTVMSLFSKRNLPKTEYGVIKNIKIDHLKNIIYDYVYDGGGLWYYKPNKALIIEYLKLHELLDDESQETINRDKKELLLDIIYKN